MYKAGIIKLTIAGLAALFATANALQHEVFVRDAAVESAAETPEPRIAGGSISSTDDFKFIAFVHGQTSSTDGSSCTGSLIAPNTVLTAAHCAYSLDTNALYLTSQMSIAFTHKRPTSMADFNGPAVKQIIIHPSFNRTTLANDISLIILQNNVSDKLATPTKIYTGDFTTTMPLTAAGFGITDPTDTSSKPAELMQVNLGAGTTAYCKSLWSSFDASKQMCTNGVGGKDTCSGDSGGPLATRVNNGDGLVIAGITSFAPASNGGPDCAQAGSTGYYVMPGKYIDWIAKQANLDAKTLGSANVTDSSDAKNDSDTNDSATNTEDPSSAVNVQHAQTQFESDDKSNANILLANTNSFASAAIGLATIAMVTLF
ncbi:hypothetical protein H4217_008241 [Coemansia sp. RSA 1939]|nr:hypothetical protein H4217_008241 [Coemansia sp. RSA 1939]KAJ2595211.1 hypothetical protein EV177_008187 [Coemansia sp. RSA 1804]KAJ2692002.1 hypothetical protein GGH99_002020 [Coemansia sp. RSA 1285]